MFNKEVSVFKVVDAETITASGSFTSPAVKTSFSDGRFSVSYTMTGTGTAKIEYLISDEKGGTYLEPSADTDIVAGVVAGSDVVSFDPTLGKYMKIRVTETGAANSVVFTYVKLMFS